MDPTQHLQRFVHTNERLHVPARVHCLSAVVVHRGRKVQGWVTLLCISTAGVGDPEVLHLRLMVEVTWWGTREPCDTVRSCIPCRHHW